MTTMGLFESSSAEWADLIQDLLSRNVSVCLHVLGNSMHPAIPSGSCLWVQRLLPGEPRVGQIAVYARSDGTLFIHRVVEKRTRGGSTLYYIVADRWFRAGEWVPLARVLGTVTRVQQRSRLVVLSQFRGWLLGWTVVLLWMVRKVCRHMPWMWVAIETVRRVVSYVLFGTDFGLYGMYGRQAARIGERDTQSNCH